MSAAAVTLPVGTLVAYPVDDDTRSIASAGCGSNSDECLSEMNSLTGLGLPRVVRPMGTPKELRTEVVPSKYKTRMCVHVTAGTACPYHPFCAFAHSWEELRTAKDNAGIENVNRLPSALLHHQAWTAAVRYTRKTGPEAATVALAATQATPPKPSYLKASPQQSHQQSTTPLASPPVVWLRDPYSTQHPVRQVGYASAS